MACRSARALSTLRAEIRKQFPQRDERSDGGCASATHTQQNPSSHHEPNSAGVATAYDYDEDLHGAGAIASEMERIAEHLRELGKGGDRRVHYIIYEGRICSSRDNWVWRTYNGPNAHEHHLHLSTARTDASVYDSTAPWGIAALFTPTFTVPHHQRKLDMPIIYSNDADGEQLYDSGTTIIVLSAGKSSAALQGADVPIAQLAKADYDKLRQEAK